jgi:hypothetical protein
LETVAILAIVVAILLAFRSGFYRRKYFLAQADTDSLSRLAAAVLFM